MAHLWAADGAPHGTAVAAREQRDGRGTRGRHWHSPLGGLWMSIVCRPDQTASAESLSLRVGLAVAAALGAADSRLGTLQLKWPNDLYLGGRKVGGILCEGRWQGAQLGWIVAGIGLNVRNELPAELLAAATTLATVVPDLAPEPLAAPIAARVAAATRAGGPLTAAEQAAFAGRDLLRGRVLREPVAGTVEGIEASGALRVRDHHGLLHVVAAVGSIVME